MSHTRTAYSPKRDNGYVHNVYGIRHCAYYQPPYIVTPYVILERPVQSERPPPTHLSSESIKIFSFLPIRKQTWINGKQNAAQIDVNFYP